MRRFTAHLVITCALLPSADGSIIRRHDQPDTAYIQLARTYTSLAHFYLPTPQGAADGEGTLISNRWVLTAAHIANHVKPGHQITIGGEKFTADSIVRHPDWNDGPHDIGLVRLTTPVTRIKPATLYRDTTEHDRVVVLVGYGDIGTGHTGPTGNDGVVRAATNRVDEATDFWLKFAFDPPGHPRVTELEGVSGPGDSGGPAFLQGAAGEILVGVSAGQSTRAAAGPGRYGVVEYYTRVSRYITWIENITGPLPR